MQCDLANSKYCILFGLFWFSATTKDRTTLLGVLSSERCPFSRVRSKTPFVSNIRWPEIVGSTYNVNKSTKSISSKCGFFYLAVLFNETFCEDDEQRVMTIKRGEQRVHRRKSKKKTVCIGSRAPCRAAALNFFHHPEKRHDWPTILGQFWYVFASLGPSFTNWNSTVQRCLDRMIATHCRKDW